MILLFSLMPSIHTCTCTFIWFCYQWLQGHMTQNHNTWYTVYSGDVPLMLLCALKLLLLLVLERRFKQFLLHFVHNILGLWFQKGKKFLWSKWNRVFNKWLLFLVFYSVISVWNFQYCSRNPGPLGHWFVTINAFFSFFFLLKYNFKHDSFVFKCNQNELTWSFCI